MPNDLSRRSFMRLAAGATTLGIPGALTADRRAAVLGGRVPTLDLLPFLARPTTSSILVNVRNGFSDASLELMVRPRGASEWQRSGAAREASSGDFVNWTVADLEPATAYEYQVRSSSIGGEPGPVASGRFTTQRVGETSFEAALITDAHTGAFIDGQRPIEVLDEVVRNVRREQPDFVLALGDNVAWPTSRNEPQADEVGVTRAYEMYRRHLGPLSMSCPHFGLIGNWEGESGKLPAESAALVSGVRRRFTPNPTSSTYPQGGSDRQDYYAFDWGPALFVVLNVQSYTEPSAEPASPRDDVTLVEDWTLGRDQIGWLERVLSGSDHPFKFICIHHAVGGNAANDRETLYGRGGPRAARVGEQNTIHEMMLDLGVQIFFYGHDHVFVDEIVDGVHYALPGSCGAPWHFGQEITGYENYWGESGHARLSVRPERATVSFVNLAGQVIHEFSVDPR